VIERQTINGRGVVIAYLTEDFQPASKKKAPLAKLVFDDGEIVFLRIPQEPATTTVDGGSS